MCIYGRFSMVIFGAGLAVLVICADRAVAKSDHSSGVVGVWSEECGLKYSTIITPRYYAVVAAIPNSASPIAFGEIDKITVAGHEVGIAFSQYYSHDFDEDRPRFKIIDDNSILYVRSKKTWEKSESIYHDMPELRPKDYVDINKDEYGVVYQRCASDQPLMDKTIAEIIRNNHK